MQWNGEYSWLIGGASVGMLVAIFAYYGGLRRSLMQDMQRRLVARQDQFISIASHYLMSPISIIQATVADLQDRETELATAERMKRYETIQRAQQRLLILADQLLIVGQIDQNMLHIKVEVGDLAAVVGDAMAAVDTFARQKEVQMRLYDYTRDVSQARFDARRMKQALVAVLDNAIKFSVDKGEVIVQVTYQAGVFTIFIQDEGIGMPKQIMEHLSEKFYRGTQLYNFDYEGAGLGLHIAYAIVSHHGGSLTFQSKPKKGTVAIIQLPES